MISPDTNTTTPETTLPQETILANKALEIFNEISANTENATVTIMNEIRDVLGGDLDNIQTASKEQIKKILDKVLWNGGPGGAFVPFTHAQRSKLMGILSDLIDIEAPAVPLTLLEQYATELTNIGNLTDSALLNSTQMNRDKVFDFTEKARDEIQKLNDWINSPEGSLADPQELQQLKDKLQHFEMQCKRAEKWVDDNIEAAQPAPGTTFRDDIEVTPPTPGFADKVQEKMNQTREAAGSLAEAGNIIGAAETLKGKVSNIEFKKENISSPLEKTLARMDQLDTMGNGITAATSIDELGDALAEFYTPSYAASLRQSFEDRIKAGESLDDIKTDALDRAQKRAERLESQKKNFESRTFRGEKVSDIEKSVQEKRADYANELTHIEKGKLDRWVGNWARKTFLGYSEEGNLLAGSAAKKAREAKENFVEQSQLATRARMDAMAQRLVEKNASLPESKKLNDVQINAIVNRYRKLLDVKEGAFTTRMLEREVVDTMNEVRGEESKFNKSKIGKFVNKAGEIYQNSAAGAATRRLVETGVLATGISWAIRGGRIAANTVSAGKVMTVGIVGMASKEIGGLMLDKRMRSLAELENRTHRSDSLIMRVVDTYYRAPKAKKALEASNKRETEIERIQADVKSKLSTEAKAALDLTFSEKVGTTNRVAALREAAKDTSSSLSTQDRELLRSLAFTYEAVAANNAYQETMAATGNYSKFTSMQAEFALLRNALNETKDIPLTDPEAIKQRKAMVARVKEIRADDRFSFKGDKLVIKDKKLNLLEKGWNLRKSKMERGLPVKEGLSTLDSLRYELENNDQLNADQVLEIKKLIEDYGKRTRQLQVANRAVSVLLMGSAAWAYDTPSAQAQTPMNTGAPQPETPPVASQQPEIIKEPSTETPQPTDQPDPVRPPAHNQPPATNTQPVQQPIAQQQPPQPVQQPNTPPSPNTQTPPVTGQDAPWVRRGLVDYDGPQERVVVPDDTTTPQNEGTYNYTNNYRDQHPETEIRPRRRGILGMFGIRIRAGVGIGVGTNGQATLDGYGVRGSGQVTQWQHRGTTWTNQNPWGFSRGRNQIRT